MRHRSGSPRCAAPARVRAPHGIRVRTRWVKRCTRVRGGRSVQRRGEGYVPRVGGEAMARMIRLLVLCLLCSGHVTRADDALVLPRGRWYVSAEARFSLPITRRFTPEGGTEDLATDF